MSFPAGAESPGVDRSPARVPLWVGGAAMWLTGSHLAWSQRAYVGQSACRGGGPKRRAASSEALCPREAVPLLDRWAIDREAPWADRASDWGLGSLLVGAVGLPWVQDAGGSAGADASGAAFATLGAVHLVTHVLKVAVRRPRPYTYSARALPTLRTSADARLSFPSGHSALAFASAMLWRRHLDRQPGALGRGGAQILGGAALLAAVGVAGCRVEAGRHFPTDVLAGAVLGVVGGWLIPRWYGDRAPDGAAKRTAVWPLLGGHF